MKPNRDAHALAESLRSAAEAPLPLPLPKPIAESQAAAPAIDAPEPKAEQPPKLQAVAEKRRAKAKDAADTVQIALRPSRALLNRYVLASSERTRKEGKVISAQQIMLEVLETGPKVQK